MVRVGLLTRIAQQRAIQTRAFELRHSSSGLCYSANYAEATASFETVHDVIFLHHIIHIHICVQIYIIIYNMEFDAKHSAQQLGQPPE